MASFSAPAIVLFVAVVALLASSVAARPGAPFHPRNILFITYSVSTTGSSSTAADVSAAPHRFYRFVSIYRTITPFSSSSSSSSFALNDGRPFLIRRPHLVRRAVAEPAGLGFGSFQERAKDIIVVVAGLLFGVGCGALTAATMYLVWSLLSSHYDACASDGEEEEDYLADSPKKAGYVQIPAADSTPAKEGYEAN
ncbi:hypothetical protein GW17_00001485 [Ensete ventricosum]|nr:hypothetical protein GW17_00001485 [Ensete ventricosum]